MSALSRPTADNQRSGDYGILNTHENSLQTRKSEGNVIYSGMKIGPPNSLFLLADMPQFFINLVNL